MECVRGSPSKQQSERLLGATDRGRHWSRAQLGRAWPLPQQVLGTYLMLKLPRRFTHESESRPAVLLCLLTISPAQPPSKSICGQTDCNQTQPAQGPLDPTTRLLIVTCLSDQPTASDRQQSSGVCVSPRTSVDLVLCVTASVRQQEKKVNPISPVHSNAESIAAP